MIVSTMRLVISSWTAKMSSSVRSNVSDQSRRIIGLTRISFAEMRMRSPARRTLPSRMNPTPSCVADIADVWQSTATEGEAPMSAIRHGVLRAATAPRELLGEAFAKYVIFRVAADVDDGSTATTAGCGGDAAVWRAEIARLSGARARSRRTAREAAARLLLQRASDRASIAVRDVRTEAWIASGAEAVRCCEITASAVGPVNGGTAREHLVHHAAEGIDVGACIDVGSPIACSGLMYAAVPSAIPTCVIMSDGGSAGSVPRAMPKSASSACPWGDSRMFSGFTSRWMTPCCARLQRVGHLANDLERIGNRELSVAHESRP